VSADLEAVAEELLRQSLMVWGIKGKVRADTDGTIVLVAVGRELRLMRAEIGLPFRWMVCDGGRRRGATSIGGMLRMVRSEVDPDYQPARVRIAPMAIVTP
jgi:hypothetical protein